MTTNHHDTNSPTNLPGFQQHQLAFTATIRDPDRFKTPDGIEERRMAIYRELVYNNIEDLLANFFPVLKQITPETRWHAIVRDFVANHKSQTPIFMKLAEEFVGFLQSEFKPTAGDPEYLLELAHYEWTEIALSIDCAEPDWASIDTTGDFKRHAPYLSPLTWPLQYQYPVHRIGPDNLNVETQPTFLLVYRDKDDEVQFMELNPVSAHLLNAIKINTQRVTKASGMQLLENIAADLQQSNPEAVISGGLQTMQQWLQRDILLGTYK